MKRGMDELASSPTASSPIAIKGSSPAKMAKLSSSPIDSFCPKISPACRRMSQPAPVTAPLVRKLGIAGSHDAQSQIKKLVIKNERTRPATSTNFTTEAMATFTRSIRAITAVPPQPIPESLQALYFLCEGCVSSGNKQDAVAQNLYDRIKMELERKVGEIQRTLTHGLAEIPQEDNTTAYQTWLKLVDAEWKSFCQQLSMIRAIFLHLDRTYVLANKSLLSIWDCGINIYLVKILEHESIAKHLTLGLLSLITSEREGTATVSCRSTFTSILSLLAGVAQTSLDGIFTQPYLEQSARLYQAEGEQLLLIEVVEPSTYLYHIQKRLNEEGERSEAVTSASLYKDGLAATTGNNQTVANTLKGQILRVVEKNLISDHIPDLLMGLDGYIELASTGLRDHSNLSLLYTLLSRVGKLTSLRTALQSHVEKHGYQIVADPAQDETMVESLLKFKSAYDDIIKKSFRGDADMAQAIRTAYEVFINKRQDKPAEMLAKYIDAKMRMGNKSATDTELEQTFDEVLYLFRFTQAKDLFEAFYTRMFAKRLLLNKSASSDMEKIMLMKLQRECGSGFTSKLETMAKDIDLSNDLMTAYKQHRSNMDSVDPFDLSVNVLTTGNWPSFGSSNAIIPADMLSSLERYKRFYASKHTGRLLTWQHALDQCTIKANFPKGRKELNVSLFQALIMLLFNDVPAAGKLSYKDILQETRLDPKEAQRILQSLACGKIRVLVKHPKGKDVAETDEFSVNEDFQDAHVRIKINQIQIKETVEEQKKTTDSVFVDRQNHVQLVIVRTLKSRKTMKHQELVMEVVNQLKNRFKVETSEIKKAISSLIERDYMERAETKDTYNYLA